LGLQLPATLLHSASGPTHDGGSENAQEALVGGRTAGRVPRSAERRPGWGTGPLLSRMTRSATAACQRSMSWEVRPGQRAFCRVGGGRRGSRRPGVAPPGRLRWDGAPESGRVANSNHPLRERAGPVRWAAGRRPAGRVNRPQEGGEGSHPALAWGIGAWIKGMGHGAWGMGHGSLVMGGFMLALAPTQATSDRPSSTRTS
jgi:hypothetical protein